MPRIQATAPFTHEGRVYKEGEQLTVSDSAAKWLIAQGVAIEKPAVEKKKGVLSPSAVS